MQRRNEHWDEGNVLAARHENLILEKYYAPVLDAPSYVSAAGHRWPAEQRAHAESQAEPGLHDLRQRRAALSRLHLAQVARIWLVVAGVARIVVLRALPPDA